MEAQRNVRSASLSAASVALLLLVANLPLGPGPADAAGPGAPEWTDVAASAGVPFRRAGDDGSNKFLPVIGGGACWGDLDGDGYEDLFLVNQLYYDAAKVANLDPVSSVYRNDGDGTFTDLTATSGLDVRAWGNGCGLGDYDADGDLDVFYTGYGANALFRNDGPFTFTNVTAAAGVSSAGACGAFPCWSTAAVWADVDADGCLDLYVTNYGEYDDATAVPGQNGPEHVDGQRNLFYHSGCDGTFTERAGPLGLRGRTGPDHGKSFQAAFFDYDGDGDDDVYIANDMVVNDLLRNDGGVFVQVAESAGVADVRAGMGLVAQDLTGDARPDLYFTHYQYQTNGLYVNNGDGTFTDHSGTGALAAEEEVVGWGAEFLDFDADGDVDILAVNGHTREIFGHYAEGRLLYRRDGAGLTYTNVNQTSGPGMADISVARGLAVADYDFDGALDFLVLNTGDSYANLLKGSGVTNHWLQVDLRQAGGNTRALGATVTVTPDGGSPVTRAHRSSASFLSQHSTYDYFGLGAATTATVAVTWPDGATETWTAPADRLVRLTKGVAAVVTDTLAPRVTATLDRAADHGAWFHNDVTATPSATDVAVGPATGVAVIESRVPPNAWAAPGPVTFTTDGRHALDVRATDHAGNTAPTATIDVWIDRVAPTSAASVAGLANGYATANSAITVTGADATSGVTSVEYRWDATSPWTPVDGPVTPVGAGAATLHHRATDAAGHTSAVGSLALTVDTAAPDVAVQFDGPHLAIDAAHHVTSATRLTLTASDAVAGVASLEVSVDGGAWTPVDEPLAFTGPDRAIAVDVRATDGAGNVAVTPLALVLDNTTPPAITHASPAHGAVHIGTERFAAPIEAAVLAGRVPVTARAGPDVSGHAATRILVDGVERASAADAIVTWEWDSGAFAPGPHTLVFSATDGLGNVATLTVNVWNLPAPLP